jgi:hypothetical protein
MLRKYIKRAGQAIVAVQLDLDTEGFFYNKWGDRQHCKRGDWLVNNAGSVYTVDQETFSRTYRKVAEGRYVKTTPVWAEIASREGAVRTKEGTTQYMLGDYLVFNEEQGGDPYAVPAEKFEQMYEPLD